MAYRVVIPKKVKKDLAKIDKWYYSKIIALLASLESNPYIGKKLHGEQQHERSCRVWPYRIMYRIKSKEPVILIVKIAHRQSSY